MLLLPQNMYSKIGKRTSERITKLQVKKRIQTTIEDDDDTDIFLEEFPEELPNKTIQIPKKKANRIHTEPFSRSTSHEKTNFRCTPAPGHYYPRYNSVQKRTTHVLPFEAYHSRIIQTENIKKQDFSLIEQKQRTTGFVDMARQIERKKQKLTISDLHYNIQQQKKQRSISFSKMNGRQYSKNLRPSNEYDPKYDFVFKKTVYVGVPFQKLLNRPENLNRTYCFNQHYDFDDQNKVKNTLLEFNQQLDRCPNPDLPAHMQKNIASRLQLSSQTFN